MKTKMQAMYRITGRRTSRAGLLEYVRHLNGGIGWKQAIFLGLLMFLITGARIANADVQFDVDANIPYNVSGNDIVRLKALASASGEDIYINDARRPHLNSIGVNIMRMWVRFDSSEVYLSNGQIVYNWASTKHHIDQIRKSGASPFCAISGLPGIIYQAGDPALAGENMIFDLLVYFNVTLGYGLKYFDFGCEFSQPTSNYPYDYTSRYTSFFNTYKIIVNAVNRYETTYPNAPKIMIGGPADGAFSFGLPPWGIVRNGLFNFYEKFITDCYNENVRLDFISFHYYCKTAAYGGHTRGAGNGAEWDAYPSLRQMIVDGWDEVYTDGSHITLKSIKYLRDTYKPNAKIYITELMTSPYDGQYDGLVNSTHVASAAITTLTKDLMEYGGVVDMAIYTFTTSPYYADGAERWDFAGGLVTGSPINGPLTKAVYNAYRMMHMMAEGRVSTTGGDRDVWMLASKNADKLTMLVANHDHYGPDSLTASDKAVNINIDNLLFKSDTLEIKENIASDSSLEDVANHWYNNYNPCGWIIDNSVKHLGSKSLKVLSGYICPGVYQPCTFRPNTPYEYSVWVKGDNVVNNLITIAYDGVYAYYTTIPAGTYDWTKVTATFTTQPTAGSGVIYPTVAGVSDGTYWFDDVELGEAVPATPRVKYEVYLVSEDTANIYHLVDHGLSVDGSEELQKIEEGTLERTDTTVGFPSFVMPKESVGLIVISKPDDLISNHGFEDAANNWNNNYYPCGWIIDNSALKVLSGYTYPGVYQGYTFRPNTPYEYSVWVKGENVVNNRMVIAYDGVYAYYMTIPAGTYDWTKVTTTFTTQPTAGSGVISVVVGWGASDGTYWFDDVQMRKVQLVMDNDFEDTCLKAKGLSENNTIMDDWYPNFYPSGYVFDDSVTYNNKSTLKISSGYTWPGVYQPFAFSPNTKYTYSVMVKGANVVNNQMAIATEGGYGHYMNIPAGTYDWTKVSTTFTTTPTADSGNISVVIGPGASGGTYWFSDVNLSIDQFQNGGFEAYHGLSAGNVQPFIASDPAPGNILPPDPPPPIVPPAGINITSPTDNQTIYQNPVITVNGTINNNSAQITVNGANATVANNIFTVSGINISPSNQAVTTLITATATYPDNTVTTSVVTVQYDPNPAPQPIRYGPQGPILVVKGCPDYWQDNYYPRGWELDVSTAHTGIRSLKIKNGFMCAGLYQQYTFKPNKTYEYSVWVKGENVVNNTMVIAYTGPAYYMTIPAGTYDWTKVTTTFTTQPTAGSGVIYVTISNASNGTYWFDDVSIIEQ